MTQELQAAAALLVLELVRHGTDDPRGNDPTAAADTDLDVGDLGFRIAEDGRRDDLAHQHQAQGAEIAQARVNVGPLRQFAAVGPVSDVAEIVLKSVHGRSEEHTSELQSLMSISYAVFCLTKKTSFNHYHTN